MIRYFLAKGDKAGSAVIIEGLKNVTCSEPPPRVHIATVGMKTYCAACNKDGVVAASGPRWPGTGPNGKPWALSGDLNMCDCTPAPVFYAERSMLMSFSEQEFRDLMEHGNAIPSLSARSEGAQYNSQFLLADGNDKPLVDTYYTIKLPSGDFSHGTTDARGLTARYKTVGSQTLSIHLGHREKT